MPQSLRCTRAQTQQKQRPAVGKLLALSASSDSPNQAPSIELLLLWGMNWCSRTLTGMQLLVQTLAGALMQQLCTSPHKVGAGS